MINKTYHILQESDWVVFAVEMKRGSTRDDPEDDYTKSEAEAAALNANIAASASLRRQISNEANACGLVFNGRYYSICLSLDEHHGHKYHMSMTQFVTPTRKVHPNEAVMEVVCNRLFKKWKSIPNPGAMQEIHHFVGDD